MFEKLLSTFGIGSAKVKTLFSKKSFERGEEVQGEVHISGGIYEQKVSEIYIHIDSEFQKDEEETTDFRNVTEPILEIILTDSVTVKPNEKKVIPFSFFLPYYMPMTFGDQKVTIEVKVNNRNHQVETKEFIVQDKLIENILQYLTDRGFKHTNKSGYCRHKKHGDSNPTHFLQTFILTNDQGTKVHFVGNEHDIHIYVYKGNDVEYYAINREQELSEQFKKLDQLTSA